HLCEITEARLWPTRGARPRRATPRTPCLGDEGCSVAATDNKQHTSCHSSRSFAIVETPNGEKPHSPTARHGFRRWCRHHLPNTMLWSGGFRLTSTSGRDCRRPPGLPPTSSL